MIKFHTPTWVIRIERVEIIRETEKFVVLTYGGRERRESKDNYFDSWDQAHQHLLDKAARTVESEKRSLDYANQKLVEVQQLKPGKQ